MYARPWYAVSAVGAVGALCIFTGCSSMAARTPSDFQRGGSTERQFQQDTTACEKQAEGHQKTYGMGGEYDMTHGAYNWMYDTCMRTSGYQRKTP